MYSRGLDVGSGNRRRDYSHVFCPARDLDFRAGADSFDSSIQLSGLCLLGFLFYPFLIGGNLADPTRLGTSRPWESI